MQSQSAAVIAGTARSERILSMLSFIILLVAPVVVGVLVGYATGGRLTNLLSVRLRGLWLLWLAVAVQAPSITCRGCAGCSKTTLASPCWRSCSPR